MPEELLYQIALTKVPFIGDVLAKELLSYAGQASDLFSMPQRQLEKIPGIGAARARAIRSFNGFETCEKEIRFIRRYHIRPLFFTDKDYPSRLKHCYDAPVMLYCKGNAILNQPHILSIIGTRRNTAYGKEVCEELVAELAAFNVTVVSGLAYGIDVIAHKAALKNKLPTVAVLAHGLDRIYPQAHEGVARQMTGQGALLTDFTSGTNPDKENFPRRNRIVAGMADAVIVIETGIRGGSLITAGIANSYNRDVFAIPGRTSDPQSAGCNFLIRNNQACLASSAQDIIDMLGWKNKAVSPARQKELFQQLSSEEKIIADIFRQKPLLHIDEIYWQSRLSSSQVAAAMLNLELQGIISSLPGKMYQWLD